MASLTEVGEFQEEINKLLGTALPAGKIFQSDGLRIHLIKHNHHDCLDHLPDIPEIISSPDYVGVNPNESVPSVEYIKVYEKNIMVGVKLDVTDHYLYVASMYSISPSKIERRLHSGRIKKLP